MEVEHRPFVCRKNCFQVLQDGPDSKELILLQDGMGALEIAGKGVKKKL